METPTSLPLLGGNSIPIVGFGTWQIHGRSAYDAVLTALEVGYRHIDTAAVYENEEEVGRALRDSGLPRHEVFITTKLRPDRPGAERAIEASLRRLGTDHVDLWLIHWPPRRGVGIELWREIVRLSEEGLATSVGVSNYESEQIDELIAGSGVVPAVNQVRWSPFVHDPARLAHSRDRGVVLEGYSPFNASRLGDPALVAIAADHGVTAAQVVLRWHVDHGIVVIPKSTHRDRIATNFDIFGFSLDSEELARLDHLSRAS